MLNYPAKLQLSSGETFYGNSPSPLQTVTQGEVVFNTSMTGYAEALTDPSYAGQILVFTYPLIGNYGVPDSLSWESKRIQVRGVIVNELCSHHSHHAAQTSLAAWLAAANIPILTQVDTRALTKRLRDQGTVMGMIAEPATPLTLLPEHDYFPVRATSITEPEYYGEGERSIILVDCGTKQNILRCLQQWPWRIKRVPYNYDYSQEAYDGVIISNGPGDPTQCQETIAILRQAIAQRKPIFGICLGVQLLALAIGAKTYKLPFGHRGQNQPCQDLATGRCYLTSQNHGYAVAAETLPNEWRISFRHLNDNTVAGIEHQTLPFSAVQFHPEAAAGPLDTQWLFERFYQQVLSYKK